MSLKKLRFHVEPVFNYRGNVVDPQFGHVHEYIERIVDWVKGCRTPQLYGCYTLWKVLHQQKRIDVLEDAITSLRKIIEQQQEQNREMMLRLERQESQIQGLVGLVQAQEERIASIHEQIAAQVTATVVETGCLMCKGFCKGVCPMSHHFISIR
jgi:hypothetical protein